MKGLDALTRMEYPGRFIIVGKDSSGECDVVVYGLTGRSPPSRARNIMLEFGREEAQFRVIPTDMSVVKDGNMDLLIYSAMIIGKKGIAVSNGNQTQSIYKSLDSSVYAKDKLEMALQGWTYEPDEPNFTPRINGLVGNGAALSIIRKSSEGHSSSRLHNIYSLENEYKIRKGTGVMVTTYTGENKNPLPSFDIHPFIVELPGESSKDMAEGVYNALNNFRIAVAAAVVGKDITSLYTRNSELTQSYEERRARQA